MSTDRRTFLKDLGFAAAAGISLGGAHLYAADQKARVVVARDATLRGASGSAVESGRLLDLLDRAMQALYDRDNPLEAWKRVVNKNEVVGLKVNCLGGRGLTTNATLVEVISNRLREVGVPPQNIVIWDRTNRDLEVGGFRINDRGGNGRVRCVGNDSAGYEDRDLAYGKVSTRLAKTLTRTCDVMINMPILKDHSMTGVTGAMKNMYGVIDNPWDYHGHAGNPYIADVNMLEPVRTRMRLTICDATTAQYEGGPGYRPQWAWRFNGLLLSNDRVAMDATAWQIIDEKRVQNGLKTLAADGREPKYIVTAADAQHRLGTSDLKQIQRVEV